MAQEAEMTPPSSLIVLPAYPGRSTSIDSFVLDAVGLAKGLQEAVGGCDVLTPRGLVEPDEIAYQGNGSHPGPSVTGRAVRMLPRPARMLLGDARSLLRAARMRGQAALVQGRNYEFVVQKHHRFHDCGLRIARQRGVPFVLKMDALEVREEAAWGLRRPIWGAMVERYGEMRVISEADLVAPVSRTLDSQLEALGIQADRRLVLDNGVDLAAFSPGPPDEDLRMEFGLHGRMVVGWVGSFRPYHGLSLVPEIARRLRDAVPEAIMCLVGTGDLFDAVASSVEAVSDVVRLVGPVPHDRVTDWIRTFDVCLLLADRGPYHYSPLKLHEYMACARPVVAAAVGEVAEVLRGDSGGILVSPGEAEAVVSAVGR